MTILDLIFVIPLAYFIFKGFQRGIVIEFFSVIALIIATIGALKLTFVIVQLLAGENQKSEWMPLLGFLLVFLAIYLLIHMLGKFLEKVFKSTNLNFINRLAGVILGVFKAVFIFSLIIWLISQVNIFPEHIKNESISYKYLKPVAPVCIELISSAIPFVKDITHQIEQFFEKIADSVN